MVEVVRHRGDDRGHEQGERGDDDDRRTFEAEPLGRRRRDPRRQGAGRDHDQRQGRPDEHERCHQARPRHDTGDGRVEWDRAGSHADRGGEHDRCRPERDRLPGDFGRIPEGRRSADDTSAAASATERNSWRPAARFDSSRASTISPSSAASPTSAAGSAAVSGGSPSAIAVGPERQRGSKRDGRDRALPAARSRARATPGRTPVRGPAPGRTAAASAVNRIAATHPTATTSRR